MPEFRISSLRYSYKGAWQANNAYTTDNIVTYQGNTYVCQAVHTSTSSFNTDLNTVVVISGLNYNIWLLLVPGHIWQKNWTPSTYYFTNNIVLYHGALYTCTTQHTSTSSFDVTKFSILATLANWNNVWTTGTIYAIGDVVKYGGIVYSCATAHTSAATAVLGLEANIANWIVVDNGIQYTSAWTASRRYKANDLVKLNADVYICSTYHTSTSTFDPTKFTLYLPGEQYSNTWDAAVIYQPGDVVKYGGYDYVGVTNNNTNNVPSTDATDWTLLTQGYEFMNDWSSSVNYKVGDVVRRSGQLVVATVDHSGQDPVAYGVTTTYTASGSSGTTLKVAVTTGITPGMYIQGVGFNAGQTVLRVVSFGTLLISAAPNATPVDGQIISFQGINPLFWSVSVPGTAWKNRWAIGTSYAIGDIAVWQNATYRCTRSHAALSGNRPDLDTTNTYWVTLVLHARHNAGNTTGDLTYADYNAQQQIVNVALPIGPEGQELRASVQADGSIVPKWNQINQSTNVFYVATTGIDNYVTNGTTQDTPFKTIKYACDFIGKGAFNRNATSLLTLNKEWIAQEVYNFMVYQSANNIYPFTSSYITDPVKTPRDIRLIVDAVINDLGRGGNSQSIAAAKSYFNQENQDLWYNTAVGLDSTYYIPALNYLKTLLDSAVNQSAPASNYQTLNGVSQKVNQTVGQTNSEAGAVATVDILVGYVITAITNATGNNLPVPNTGLSCTVFVKTGTYPETLPIVVPETCAIVGDELRGTVVQPKLIINTTISASASGTNKFTAASTTGMYDRCPVQFVTSNPDTPLNIVPFEIVATAFTGFVTGTTLTVTEVTKGTLQSGFTLVAPGLVIGTKLTGQLSSTETANAPNGKGTYSLSGDMQNLAQTVFTGGTMTAGQTYYVIGATLTSTTFQVSATSGGAAVQLVGGTGLMQVFGGDAIQDMFRMRNATGLRNMTFVGKLGTLTAANTFGTQRPTGGSYVALDPGTGPNDTNAWIIRRSPYIQNVTTFGIGCTGFKIDGSLHNGGNKSMVSNDFTQIIQDGIGVWCIGTGALTECISVFSYYSYCAYYAEAGGKIRAANGNSSYGVYGAIAEGYDTTESPITGKVYNRFFGATATVQSAFGANANLLSITYQNSGQQYTQATTNLIKYSGNYLGQFSSQQWKDTNDIPTLSSPKLLLQINQTSPDGNVNAWTASSFDSSIGIAQTVTIPTTGGSYAAVGVVNIASSGVGALFNVSVSATAFTVTLNFAGAPNAGYSIGDTFKILGSSVGGLDNVHDIIITVSTLTASASSIATFTYGGAVPSGAAMNYVLSQYIYQGTSPTVNLTATFGSSYVSGITYNFAANTVTPFSTGGGFTPITYGVVNQNNGWFRIWFAAYDPSAAQTTLKFTIYPSAVNSQTTKLYGSQLERNTTSLGFYLTTNDNTFTAFADYIITGAGNSVQTVGEELRTNGVFQTRQTDPGTGVGGQGYLTASNDAQAGTVQYVTLSQADSNQPTNYVGMRVFINSGTGAGQYGYISNYNVTTKNAYVLKESFTNLQVTATSSLNNYLTLAAGSSLGQLYVGQPIQFIPTYYTTTVTASSQTTIAITSSQGGSGGGSGQPNCFYTSNTAQLTVGMPVQFTGNTFGGVITNYQYYVSAIVDSNNFQVAVTLALVPISLITVASGSMGMAIPGGTNYLTATSTANMTPCMPVQFTGSTLGGGNITNGTIYYVQDVIDSTTFSIANALTVISVSTTDQPSGLLTTASTTNLLALTPIIFTGTVIGGLVSGQKYYVSTISGNGTQFSLCSSLRITTATATNGTNSRISVASTAGMVVGNPIRFIGNTFGGITANQVYYVAGVFTGAITIATTPGGGAFPVQNGAGALIVNTSGTAVTLTANTGGAMIGTTTSAKIALTYTTGAMNTIYSTSLFGNVNAGQTYYILNIVPGTPNNIQISTTPSGGALPVNLNAGTGNMQFGWVGWDHVNPGTPAVASLDITSVYFIEPRLTYSLPAFSQQVGNAVVLASGTYSGIAYSNYMWMAIANAGNSVSVTTDGTTWTSQVLPIAGTWSSVAGGNKTWVILQTGSQQAVYSNNNGAVFQISNLPSLNTWSSVQYGNNFYVALAAGTNASAWSKDYGQSWSGISLPQTGAWTNIAYGAGTFVTLAQSSTTYGYIATQGTSTITGWSIGTLPIGNNWTSICYGGGKFVAISNPAGSPIYSFDGITWNISPFSFSADKITYGQGVFVAVSASTGAAYTSEDGIIWTTQTIAASGYQGLAFGYTAATAASPYNGVFVSISGDASSSSQIFAGCRAKGRGVIFSGVMSSVNMFEPGSNYAAGTGAGSASLTIFDPNVTILSAPVPRLGSMTLSGPTFANRGLGYNTNTTTIYINGSGYADNYQTGLNLYVSNLSLAVRPGDDLTITGDPNIYKVTSCLILNGTVAPNITALLTVSPGILTSLATANGTNFIIREKYSQCRMTNHDFLNIGYGDQYQSNYPGVPLSTSLGVTGVAAGNQTVEINYGRIFFSSTDQDGNFKVGNLFAVQQATGTVTISASQFNLSGLTKLTLQGVAIGSSQIVISQFSTDATFVANSDAIVPTQKAIRSYLSARLSQGGSNTSTGQVTSGDIVIGGPNVIDNSIRQISGPKANLASIKFQSKANFNGNNGFGQLDGNAFAFDFFIKNGSQRGSF
jgi:hypothetical protein